MEMRFVYCQIGSEFLYFSWISIKLKRTETLFTKKKPLILQFHTRVMNICI
jgi:hypothetical protein